MAAIGYMRDATVTIDTFVYQGQCSRAELVPNVEKTTFKTLDPDVVYQDVDTPDWSLNLTLVQDFAKGVSPAPDGLARYLTDHHGQQLDVVLEPKAGGQSWAVTVLSVVTNVGGERGNFATSEVELPVVGQPVITDPA